MDQTAHSLNKLGKQLHGFSRWKHRQLKTLAQLEPWLKQQGLFTSEAQRAISHAQATLEQDHIKVAVVGEFSRGKTELINALFFGDQDTRLLPTDAGRTTMCPTEIFQNDKQPPSLRLLPIETRLLDLSLRELRQQPQHWQEVALDISDSGALQKSLLRIKESRSVSWDDAERMGFVQSEAGVTHADLVTIPAWRLAELNYRHPLLAQGLRILDTPGLNTVSSEPELTYEILPSVQACIFVLSADTGVTKSDLEMWQQVVMRPGSNNLGVLVVVNKIDTLWDELRSEEEIATIIRRQCKDVAEVLEIDVGQVFPMSAQKALVGRIRKDIRLEQRSGILSMERQMAARLVANQQQIVVHQSTQLVNEALATIETLVSNRLSRMQQQATGLDDLSDKSEQAIAEMLVHAQHDRVKYQASIEAYKLARNEFSEQGKQLLRTLNPQNLNPHTEQARKAMTSAMSTTWKLKDSIVQLFATINRSMDNAASLSQDMRRLIRTIHRRFESQHAMGLGEPKMFSIITHQVALNLVHQESEIFRKSSRTTLTEQHLVTKRYFQTIVSRVEEIFRSAHNDAKDWLETALDPLTMQVHEHRKLLAEQMNDLKHASQSRTTVKQRIASLKRDTARLQGQLTSIQNVRQALGNTTLPEEDGRVRPTLVKKSA